MYLNVSKSIVENQKKKKKKKQEIFLINPTYI